MKQKLTIIFIIIQTFTLISVIYLLVEQKTEKTAFFINAKVYNDFDYKIELEKDLDIISQKNKSILDSLEINYQMTISSIEGETLTDAQINLLKMKQQNFFELKDKFDYEYKQKQVEFHNLIWDRVNGYVKEYGEKKGYTYIFGANGDGSLMYAKESSDITEELIIFINNKFRGE